MIILSFECQFAQNFPMATVQIHDYGIMFWYSIDYFLFLCYNSKYDTELSAIASRSQSIQNERRWRYPHDL